MKKKLYRSRNEKMIAGVCGGVAEYFEWDPSIIRIAFAILTVLGFSGIVIYIIAAIVIPLRPANLRPEHRFVDAEYEVREENDV